jgi:hypothetical protein
VPWVSGLLGLVLVVSAWVRLTGVDLGWFMVDQARDVSEAMRIAQGQRFPLVGPIAQDLYALGPLYYYLIALPLRLSPRPEAAVFFVALLNLSTVYMAYRIGREFFSPTVGLVAAALYGVFPMAVISARTLWNPGLIPFFSVTFLYAFFRFLVRGQAWGLTLAMVALPCLLQVHLSGLALLVLFLVALLLLRPRIPWRAALVGSGAVLALFSSYLVFEARRGFRAFPDALRFLQVQGQIVTHESWAQVVWRAIRAPFVIPAQMAAGFISSPVPAYVRPVQEVELALFVSGGLWLLAASLLRGRRTGVVSKAEVLLLLWIAVPLLTLTNKKQVLLWYYFDLLYPAQFLVISLLVDDAMRALGKAPGSRATRRLVGVVMVAGIAAIVGVQVGFLEGLRHEVSASGLLRLPTSIALRFPDPLWFVKERGYLELMPLRYKRAITQGILAEAPLTEEAFYRRVHGAVFEGLLEDSGLFYWLLSGRLGATRAEPASVDGSPREHWLVLRAVEWPAGVREIRRRVGPYWLIRAVPAIAYDRWRCGPTPEAGWTEPGFDDRAWPRAVLPARVIPEGSVYVIPPLTAWGGMPLACRGWMDGDGVPTALVVSLRTTPHPDHRVALEALAVNGRPVAPSQTRSSLTAMHRHTEVVFDVRGSLTPGPNLVAFEVVGGVPAFDLDVYAVATMGPRGT